ncbi:phage major capsid protein [Xanthobacter dioxanivorans]|uniref:Phage major capsid protein n=1 Tax=Xanthobacter dioxanivorans TaxID=2528964 RepID=A0A974PJL4_9HYPH|nr:phage major capsid protein [Xanthobacter dioxanivorans]QRG04827.1 phage major capsid protein [Xanthobacter dioxanivorans]
MSLSETHGAHAGAPETKVAGAEARVAVADFLAAFEAYKQVNDARLAEVERRSEDVLTTEQMARIDATLDAHKARLDDIATKARRPHLGTAAERSEPSVAARAHSGAFDAYARHGEAGGLKALEAKAMSAGTGADGGYLVPYETETEIGRRLSALSPIRAISSVRVIGAGTYRKPFMTSGPVSGWAAETAARPQTDSPVLAELAFPAMELYAMPAATQALLDDAQVNVEEWLAQEVDTAFAEQESVAFVTGDGVAKPKGFLAYTKVAESAWAWDKVGYVASGSAGAFPASTPADPLVDLVYALKAGYRQNASFVMNRKTQGAVRKLKDENGNYLWAPPAGVGQAASLMGFPVVESEAMPDLAADAYAIAFGDFRRFYLVVDRAGVRVLRDPYSAKPYVLFYTTKRVGGGVQDFDAAKLMKFAAS